MSASGLVDSSLISSWVEAGRSSSVLDEEAIGWEGEGEGEGGEEGGEEEGKAGGGEYPVTRNLIGNNLIASSNTTLGPPDCDAFFQFILSIAC